MDEKIITKAPRLNTLRCHFVDSTGPAKEGKHPSTGSPQAGSGQGKKRLKF
jgi:hypothetical protein